MSRFSLASLAALFVATYLCPAEAGSLITFDGFQWEALGQAHLSVAPDGLHVTNVGSTGNDGVRLLVPDGLDPTAIDTTIFGSGLGTPSSPNGEFQTTLRGTINGSPQQPIYILSATPMIGGGVALDADMSPVAPTSLTASCYDHGALVATETGI
jgi:hypothetical protein